MRAHPSFIVAGAGLALAVAYLLVGREYSLGTLPAPGPGLFPRGLGVVLAAVSVWGMRQSLQSGPAEVLQVKTDGGTRTAVVVAALLVFAAALPSLGSIPAIFLLSAISLFVMGWRSWSALAGGSLVISLSVHFLFASLLGSSLPQGIWPW